MRSILVLFIRPNEKDKRCQMLNLLLLSIVCRMCVLCEVQNFWVKEHLVSSFWFRTQAVQFTLSIFISKIYNQKFTVIHPRTLLHSYACSIDAHLCRSANVKASYTQKKAIYIVCVYIQMLFLNSSFSSKLRRSLLFLFRLLQLEKARWNKAKAINRLSSY